MTLYLTGYQKYEKSNLNLQLLSIKYKRFQLCPVVFLIPLEVQGHTYTSFESSSVVFMRKEGLVVAVPLASIRAS